MTGTANELKWDSLESIGVRARLIMMYKMSNRLLEGNWSKYMLSNREIRGSHDFKFAVPKGNKNVFRFSFSPRTISEWNRLQSDIVLAKTVGSFNKKKSIS